MIEILIVVLVVMECMCVWVFLCFGDGFIIMVDVVIFDGFVDGCEYLLFGFGDWCGVFECVNDGGEDFLVCLYSECFMGDVFGFECCDCGL